MQSIEFKDLPFGLWEIKGYANETISFRQYRPTSRESTKTIEQRDDEVKKVDDEIKVYTEEDHFNYAIPEIRELAINHINLLHPI